MRSTLLLSNLALLLPLSAAQLIIADLQNPSPAASPTARHLWEQQQQHQRQQLPQQQQTPQYPIMPPPGGPDDPVSVQPAVLLADILGSNRALTTFSSLTRRHASTESLLGSGSDNTTVLAPLNSVVEALPRRPWENPRDYAASGAAAYSGDAGQDRADDNLRRFVEAHLVACSPWAEGEKAKTIGGRELWWEKDANGKLVIRPDGVEVDKVASRVANGEVWILKGVLNYE